MKVNDLECPDCEEEEFIHEEFGSVCKFCGLVIEEEAVIEYIDPVEPEGEIEEL